MSENEGQRYEGQAEIKVVLNHKPAAEEGATKGEAQRDDDWQRRHSRAQLLFTAILVLFTAIYATASICQLVTLRDTLDETKRSFVVGQRPYVVFGRPDGVIAEFSESPDPNEWASIKLFFQNGGNLPASNFNIASIQIFSVPPNVFESDPAPASQRMSRFKSDDGSIGLAGSGVTIAGHSTHVHFVHRAIRQKALNQIQAENNIIFIVNGQLEYCDGFGRYTCKSFLLHSSPPYSAFEILHEFDCSSWYRFPDIGDRKGKYLLPCEQPDEYDEEEKRAREQLMREAPILVAPTRPQS